MSTPTVPPTSGTISAAVVKPDGTLMAGVTFALTGPSGRQSARVGDSGKQAWPALPWGSYAVALSALTNWTVVGLLVQTVVLSADKPTATVTFNVVPKVAPPTATPTVPVTPVATPPVATPGPTPTAPLGGIVCGFGASAGVQATYALTAGDVARFSSIGLTPTLRGYTRVWTIGGVPDPQPDPRHVLDPVAFPVAYIDRNVVRDVEMVAVRCLTVGTTIVSLAITCTATGVTTHYAQTVNVVPDTRVPRYVGPGGNNAADGKTAATAWLTWAKARTVFAAAHAALVVLGDLPDAATSDTRLGVGHLLTAVRKPDGTRPTLRVSGCPAFSGWDNETSGAVVRGLCVTADPTTVKPDMVNGVAVKTAVGTKFIVSRGDGVTLDDCEFGTLQYGALVESGDGFALLGCVQPDPLSIQAQALMHLSAGTLVMADNALTGSQREDTERFESGRQSVASYRNLVAERGGINGKAEFTARVGNRVCSWADTFDGGTNNAQVGTSTTAGPGSVANVTADVLFSEPLLFNSSFNCTANTVGISILKPHVDSPAGVPHVTVTPPGVSDFVVEGGTTNTGPFKLKVAAPMVGLVTDALVTGADGKVVRAAQAVAAAVAFPVVAPAH